MEEVKRLKDISAREGGREEKKKHYNRVELYNLFLLHM